MGITVHWDNDEQTIIRLDFEGQWDWDALNAANADIVAHVAKVNHPAAVIANLGDSRPHLPRNPLDLFRAINGGGRGDGLGSGGVVVVGAGRMLKTLYNTAVRAAGRGAATSALRFADSLDEARALLKT